MEKNNMHFLVVCLLLALGSTARGDDASRCSQGGVTELRDTLRQSACRLGAKRTEGDVFRARVRAKHGVDQAVAYFSLADLFRLTATKVWCRTTCPDPTPENVTWCVNIAYLDRDVETCITTDATQEVVTNSSCEAEAVGLPSYLSLPSDCSSAGRVGCLGLTNLDWFFKSAYMTCTVHTDTCYQKSFTELGTKYGVAQPPEFDVFPTSPLVVLRSNRIVLHAEISSTVDRNIFFWQHNGKMYKKFIFEDPYCDRNIEECHNDSHPDAIPLRLQRVRVYRFTRVINLNGCQQSRVLYRLESYLIVDNAGEEDSGEYTLNITTSHSRSSSFSVVRSVNISVNDVLDGYPANTTDKRRDQSSDECSDKCSELTVAVVIAAVLGPLLGALIGALLTILALKFFCKNAPATHLSSKHSEMVLASSPITKETSIISEKAASSETQS